VVGDGALTGGLAWEALNNLATSPGRVVVVLNDNGRSYSPTVGGLAAHLALLRTGRRSAGNLFEIMGLAYLGPVDAHDPTAVEVALARARTLDRSVVVHCVSRKGAGYPPAEADDADRLHTIAVTEPATGRPLTVPGPTWTDVFADELVALGRRHRELVAVSAAMLGPTGLARFAVRYPARTVDVGIAEQHAITSAAGLAMTGRHPVVAIYATFLNRAFDQVLMDVALHRLPVTLVLDRAGITGPDGPSHHGVWDLAALGLVPGLRIAAPRDPTTVREQLREAVTDRSGPTALRFPKAPAGPDLPVLRRVGGVDVLHEDANPETLIVAVGAMAAPAVAAAQLLAATGHECTVVDPRWVRPVPPVLATLAAGHRQVCTVEDGVRAGGAGAAVARYLAEQEVGVPVHVLGLPDRFVPHGSRGQLLARYGLDAAGIAVSVAGSVRDPAEPVLAGADHHREYRP